MRVIFSILLVFVTSQAWADLEPIRWEKHGRTYRDTESGKMVWWSSVSSENIEVAQGKYAPYVLDEEKRIVRFGTAEIRLLSGGDFEFWVKGEKKATGRFIQEIEKTGQWEATTVTASELRFHTMPQQNSFNEVVEVSYDLVSTDQKTTVKMLAGGRNFVDYDLTVEGLKAGRQRLRFDAEVSNSSVRPIEASPLDNTLVGYRLDGWQWTWKQDEARERTSRVEPGNVSITLAEKEYTPGQKTRVSPDTWGAYGVGFSGSEFDTAYPDGPYSCSEGAGWGFDYLAWYGANYVARAVEQWDVSTIDASWTIDAIEMQVYVESALDSPSAAHFNRFGTSHGEDDPVTGCSTDSGNIFTKIDKTGIGDDYYASAISSTSTGWNGGAGWRSLNSTAISDLTWIRDNAYDDWCVSIYDTEPGDSWAQRYLTEYGQANEAQLRVTYTAGAGGAPPAQKIQIMF